MSAPLVCKEFVTKTSGPGPRLTSTPHMPRCETKLTETGKSASVSSPSHSNSRLPEPVPAASLTSSMAQSRCPVCGLIE